MNRFALTTMTLPGWPPGAVRPFARRSLEALRHRREIMHLAEFDDRMLKDIGLTRSDVERACRAALPQSVPGCWFDVPSGIPEPNGLTSQRDRSDRSCRW